MDTTITVIQVLMSLFIAGGLVKVVTPYAKYLQLPGQGWAYDFKPEHIRLIGAFEVGAGLSMLIPLFLHSLTILVPLAAVGMALVMGGALATHLRRSEYLYMAVNAIWLGLALVLAYGKLVGFSA